MYLILSLVQSWNNNLNSELLRCINKLFYNFNTTEILYNHEKTSMQLHYTTMTKQVIQFHYNKFTY